MVLYILKKKRFKQKFFMFFPFITFIFLLFIMFKTEGVWIKILLGLNILYFFSPHIYTPPKEGIISLDSEKISINVTNIKKMILLQDLQFCKIEYGGYRNEINIMAGGFSFVNGINTILLSTKEKEYKYEFLSTKESDEKGLLDYIDILRKKEISFYLNIKGKVIT